MTTLHCDENFKTWFRNQITRPDETLPTIRTATALVRYKNHVVVSGISHCLLFSSAGRLSFECWSLCQVHFLLIVKPIYLTHSVIQTRIMKFGTSFILAALVAMNAVVSAQPVHFKFAGFELHPPHLKITTTRSVFYRVVHRMIITPHLVQDFYDMVVKIIIHKKTELVPAHLQAIYRPIGQRDNIEERSYWDADDNLKSRELNHEPMLEARWNGLDTDIDD
ncbi:hypothetical protein AX14_001487 [Amanita brunnescens Koide BX004]|nr:hypothetical protein AX14_001487 [Amanita brunnescens Koide BX004]